MDTSGTDIGGAAAVVIAPLGKIPRDVAPSHIGTKHIGLTADQLAARGIKASSTFPNQASAAAALGKANFPPIPPGGSTFLCDEFCGWGIRAQAGISAKNAKLGMAALRANQPNTALWTVADLNANGFEFVITRQAQAFHNVGREATLFPMIDHAVSNAGNALVDQAALNQLGAATLQDAMNGQHAGWRAVSSGTDLNIVQPNAAAGTGEAVVKARGNFAKNLGKVIIILAVMIQTAFFVNCIVQSSPTDNHIAMSVDYASKVGLAIGAYFVTEAVGTAMAVAGYSALAIGTATLGIGLVFAAVGLGIGMLIHFFANSSIVIGEWKSDLFVQDALFIDSTGRPAQLFVGELPAEYVAAHQSKGSKAGAKGFRSEEEVSHDLISDQKHYLAGNSTASHVSNNSHYLAGSAAPRSDERPF